MKSLWNELWNYGFGFRVLVEDRVDILMMQENHVNRASYVVPVIWVINLALPLVFCVVLSSKVFMLSEEIVFPFVNRYEMNMVLQYCFGCLILLRFTILLISPRIWFADDRDDSKHGLMVDLWMVCTTFQVGKPYEMKIPLPPCICLTKY